jgi:hypothetical protein
MITLERYFVAAAPASRLPWLVRFPERLSQWLSHLRIERLLGLLAHAAELALLTGGILSFLLLARSVLLSWQRRQLAAGGTSLELRLSDRVERSALLGLFERLAAQLPRPLLGATPWIGAASVAFERELRLQLFCSAGVAVGQVREAVAAALPGCTVEASVENEEPNRAGREGTSAAASACVLVPRGDPMLPFRVKQETDPARQVLAALAGQENGEGGVVQFLLSAAPARARRRARRRARKLLDPRPRSGWPAPLGLLAEVASGPSGRVRAGRAGAQWVVGVAVDGVG